MIHLSRLMTKPIKWHVRSAKTQISLGICPVWSESSLSAWRKLGSLASPWAHSEDWSDWADAQADLSLRWAHSHFVGFIMRRLIFWQTGMGKQCRSRSDWIEGAVWSGSTLVAILSASFGCPTLWAKPPCSNFRVSPNLSSAAYNITTKIGD